MGIAEAIVALGITMVICAAVILIKSWRFPNVEELQRQMDKRVEDNVRRIMKEEGWFKDE